MLHVHFEKADDVGMSFSHMCTQYCRSNLGKGCVARYYLFGHKSIKVTQQA